MIRKKKLLSLQKWKSFDFGEEKQTVNSKSMSSVVNLNFFQQLQPKLVTDLAVHAKKIKEVEDWLRLNVIVKSRNHVSDFLLCYRSL